MSKSDIYFCGNCGTVLPEEQVLAQPKKYFDTSKSNHKEQALNIKRVSLVAIPLSLVVFLTVAFAADTYRYVAGMFTEPNHIASDSDETLNAKQSTQSADAQKDTHGISVSNPETYLPFNSDIVIEAYTPADYLDLLSFFNIQNSIAMDTLGNEIKSPYILLGHKEDEMLFSVILFPKSEQGAEQIESSLEASFKVGYPKPVLVATTSPDLITELSDVSKSLKKGLNLNSRYVEIKKKIPDQKRMAIFAFSDAGILYLNSLKTESAPELLTHLMKSYLDGGSYYGFVK